MTLISVNLAEGGASEVTALAGGVQAAFLIGAILSVGLIVIAFILKRPANAQERAEELTH
jgi:DHA2 family lincomycin resistance protein-like MFS transporter